MRINPFWNNTLIYGVGFLGLRAISFLLLPLYTNLLSPHEAGILFIIYTILAFLNTIYNRGMDSSLLKFFNTENEKTIISTSIIYSIIYSFVLSLLIFIIYTIVNHYGLVYRYSLPFNIIYFILIILFSDMLSSRCMHIIRLQNRPWYYLLVSLVNVLASIILNLYFIIILKQGVYGALMAIFGVSIIQFMFLTPILIFKVRLNLMDRGILSKMLNFSRPFLPAAIFFILIELSDRWFINWLSFNHIMDVGLYGAGYKVGSIMLLIVRGFNLNWQPFYIQEQGGTDSIRKFTSIGNDFINIMIVLGTLIVIGFPVAIKTQILGFSLIGEAFWDGLSIIPIIVISYLFYGVFILQMPSIYIKNKQNWAPYFWGMGFIINAIFNMILIPKYQFMGAAISTCFAYFSMMALLLYKNKSWMKIKYNNKSIIVTISVSLILYLISFLCRENPYFVYCFPLMIAIYIMWSFKYLINKKKLR